MLYSEGEIAFDESMINVPAQSGFISPNIPFTEMPIGFDGDNPELTAQMNPEAPLARSGVIYELRQKISCKVAAVGAGTIAAGALATGIFFAREFKKQEA